MVVSKIDSSIDYPDSKFVDPDDLDYDAQLYQIELFPNLEVVIALGKVKYTFVDKNVLYIPVYLTDDGEVLVQIGVYEFPANIYTSLLDEDNDFDISLLENPLPLTYKFANESFVRKQLNKKKPKTPPVPIPPEDVEVSTTVDVVEPEQKSKTKKPSKDEDEDSIELSMDSRVPNKQTIVQELFEEDDDERPEIKEEIVAEEAQQEENFKEHRGHNWLEKFMRNENYGIVDNEGKGDCLFATIRDSYSGIGKQISVAQLRQIASDAATPKVFADFKEQYDMYSSMVQQLGARLTELQGENRRLKQQYQESKDRDTKAQIVAKSKPIVKEFKQARKEKKGASEMLHEFRWMRGVDSLEKLKKKMRMCNFWAETWTIQTLENILNIKLIILSSDNYENGDYDNVLQCGDMVPESIEKKGEFKPKYYMILDYTGNHYKLITYKQKRIFEFKDIPLKLKKMIVDKCMESKGKSIYDYIPKFKLIQARLKEPSKSPLSPGDDAGPEDQGDADEEAGDEGSNLKEKPGFDEETVFQFYSKSADKPLPGKGSGEKINAARIKEFAELASIVGWRKVLSNFHMAPFKLDNRTWNSVEHYYHANKFKKNHPDFYQLFTVESDSDISKDPAFAKAAGGKTGKYKKMNYKRPKDIVIDEDFFSSGRAQQIMEAGQRAKYTQNEIPKRVLLATKNAKLQHHVRGSPPIIFYDSMKIREELKAPEENKKA